MFSQAISTKVEKISNDLYRVHQKSGSAEIDRSRESIELRRVERKTSIGDEIRWQVYVNGESCQWFWDSPQELAKANIVI